MIVSINQPAYIPWLGYFDRICRSDVHIVLDHVQFEKNSMVNRNKLKTAQGVSLITVPLKTKGKFNELAINTVEINNSQNWRKKHWHTIKFSYAKSLYFAEYKNVFAEIYATDWLHLNDLLKITTKILFELLGIKTKIIYSSEIKSEGKKGELVLNLCKEAGATEYISGPFGRDYLNKQSFAKEAIGIKFHDYQHPEYKQLYSGFEPYMSVIDLIFNHGPRSLEILTSNQSLSDE